MSFLQSLEVLSWDAICYFPVWAAHVSVAYLLHEGGVEVSLHICVATVQLGHHSLSLVNHLPTHWKGTPNIRQTVYNFNMESSHSPTVCYNG